LEQPHGCSPVVELLQIQRKALLANSESKLTAIFQKLETQSQSPEFITSSKVAESSINTRKNRYKNVLALDHNRVVLPTQAYENKSDYINASWITPEKHYIAAQGPLKETIDDFWMMIWDNQVPVIVMLTKEDVFGEAKCVKYWPSASKTAQYGPFRVVIQNVQRDLDHIIHRRFLITNTNNRLSNQESRTVDHFQYVGWPDHGVPKTIGPFVHLIQAISGSPVVVHCSAGIGRTGTFCCIDILAKKIKRDYPKGAEPTQIENLVFDTVLDLRRQRSGMVQTQEQFHFCFVALVSLLSEIQA